MSVCAPAWAVPPGDYGPPITQCSITDPEIDEVSGLVALTSGEMLLVEDSAPEPRPGATSVLMYRLDSMCAVQDGVVEFDQDPRDIEDLAFQDSTVWFADIGDNSQTRPNVALISAGYDAAAPQGQAGAPLVFRLAYPDGPHDAEALLLAPDGIPYIVTKELSGRSGVYRPAGPLDPSAEVAMEKVAELEFAMTGTPGGPVGRAGQLLVTGGTVAADHSHIALRTYTDAYVWTLAGNDVARALQSDPIAVIALPDAPQGEAISFAPDSRSLLVGSEGVNSVITAVPATSPPEQTQTDTAGRADPGAGTASADRAAPDSASSEVTAGLIAVAMVAVVAGATWLARRIRRNSSPR
ncbi:MAG: hypothetical protein H0T99_06510 [Geodermatophilaceae bacterium]|nr:hypothetical protein [Geodermatophilaceae bacterium]